MVTSILAAALVVASLFPAQGLRAEARPNSHNAGDCLFCHRDPPRFGVDTKATVTFRETSADDPALCLRCHRPEENLHPLRVKPAAPVKGPAGALPLGEAPGLEGQVTCTTCHFVHASDASWSLLRGFPGSQEPGLFRAWQDFCRQCHGEDLEKRSPHAGDDKACVFCHQAVPKKGVTPVLAPRSLDLCGLCHGNVGPDHYAGASPFGGRGDCSDCHDPHLGPDHPGRLKESYLAAVKGLVTLNPHYRRALCLACHREGEGRPLLTDDPNALCNRCHGSGEIPADAHPLKSPPSGMKIPEGWPLKAGSLTCLSCHRAGHAEDRRFYKFLRGGPYADPNDVCFQCHLQEAFSKVNPHGEIDQLRGCEFCHVSRPTPGKDRTQTVRFLTEVNLLCRRCHAEAEHPGGSDHLLALSAERAATIPAEMPVGKNNRLNCATCHNPHDSETGNYKLRGGLSGMEVCGLCHRL